MNKELIKHELTSLLKTLSFWLLILCSFLIVFMLAYPLFIDNKDLLATIFENSSDFTLTALGINVENAFTPVGYYSIIFKFITVLAAVEAAVLATKIITNDSKNIMLYTMPIKRNTIMTSKFIALLICLIITNIVYQITSCAIMFFLADVNFKILLLLNFGLLLLQITFASINMMIASFVKKKRTISIISYVSIIVFYVLSVVEAMIDNIILRYINPFSYFKPTDVLNNGGYNQGFLIASVFIVFYMVNFSYIHNNELEM